MNKTHCQVGIHSYGDWYPYRYGKMRMRTCSMCDHIDTQHRIWGGWE